MLIIVLLDLCIYVNPCTDKTIYINVNPCTARIN